MTPLKIAKSVAEFASDKKAEEIVILDMRKVTNFCDYFVICTGNTDRQVRAIARGIDEGLEQSGIVKVQYKQGLKDGQWAILDLGHVVAHIFSKAARDFYGLDHLWQGARKVVWPS